MDNWALDSDCLSYLAAEEVAQLFEKKELSPPQDPLKKDVPYSRLTDLLESSVSMGENPFLEYAKFDGKVRQNKVGAISIENLCTSYYQLQPARIYLYAQAYTIIPLP